MYLRLGEGKACLVWKQPYIISVSFIYIFTNTTLILLFLNIFVWSCCCFQIWLIDPKLWFCMKQSRGSSHGFDAWQETYTYSFPLKATWLCILTCFFGADYCFIWCSISGWANWGEEVGGAGVRSSSRRSHNYPVKTGISTTAYHLHDHVQQPTLGKCWAIFA